MGDDVPLEILLGFDDVEVGFHETYGIDVASEFMLKFRVVAYPNDRSKYKELLYDKFGFTTSFNLEMEDDKIYGKILASNVNAQYHFDRENLPIRNSMNMTESDYKEFLNDLQFSINTAKRFYNDVVLRHGYENPLKLEDFETRIHFNKKAAFLFFDPKKDKLTEENERYSYGRDY